MAQKPSIPKGTRDFSPVEMARRNYIFDTIKSVFALYGFRQIETPAMENLSTLMGKYGEEGDKLLFKILNSGDFLSGIASGDPVMTEPLKLAAKICEKGLRYDLTVPFARYVVQHRNDIALPFKRFQIQPVWRADRPQKGRYREFYQCDADIVGSNSYVNEVELLQIIDEVFARLNVSVTIKLNNRKVLAGIAELIGAPDKLIDITTAIDKIDKIGIENVEAELIERGLNADQVAALRPILMIDGSIEERLEKLSLTLTSSPIGVEGVSELKQIISVSQKQGMRASIDLDVSLARGLNYYTGTIIEVKANDVHIGSISGGGRYDNLTGVFGLAGIPGVGISFGADRIYDVLNTLNLYPDELATSTQALIVNFGNEEDLDYAFTIARNLRSDGISAEIYPDAVKIQKQMKYANDTAVKYVIIAGEQERADHTVTLKNMSTGHQETISLDALANTLSHK